MNKLIIASVAVVFSIVANAASVKWTTPMEIANATEDGGVTAATLVYLIDAATLSQSSIYESVSGGKTLADAIGANSVKSASLSGGKISNQAFDAFNAGDSKTLYMVLFDSGIGENGALYFSEQAVKTLSGTGTTTFSFSSDSSINAVASSMTGFSASDGGWVAVPEPTSGLLLVLGMAGLMLRRRRA